MNTKKSLAIVLALAAIGAVAYFGGYLPAPKPPVGKALVGWDIGLVQAIGPKSLALDGAAGKRTYLITSATRSYDVEWLYSGKTAKGSVAVVTLDPDTRGAKSIALLDEAPPIPLDEKAFLVGDVLASTDSSISVRVGTSSKRFLLDGVSLTRSRLASLDAIKPQDRVQISWVADDSGRYFAGGIYPVGK